MRALCVLIWICSGILTQDSDQLLTDTENVKHLSHIKSIPLYANLIEQNFQPDENGRFLNNGLHPALPVELDIQLLSINGGMY